MSFSVEVIEVRKGDSRLGYLATNQDLEFRTTAGVKRLHDSEDGFPPPPDLPEDRTPVQLSPTIDQAIDYYSPTEDEAEKFATTLTGLRVFQFRIPEYPDTIKDNPLIMPLDAVAQLDKRPCNPAEILRQLIHSPIWPLSKLGIAAVTFPFFPAELAMQLFDSARAGGNRDLLNLLREHPQHGKAIQRLEQRLAELIKCLQQPPPQ